MLLSLKHFVFFIFFTFFTSFFIFLVKSSPSLASEIIINSFASENNSLACEIKINDSLECVDESIPSWDALLKQIGLSYSLSSTNCWLHRFKKHDAKSSCSAIASRIVVKEHLSYPDSQGWSECQNCVWSNKNILLIMDENANNSPDLQLSWSYWGEFFHASHNDQVKAKVISSLDFDASRVRNALVLTKPVFFLPLLTVHAGHVFVDYMEQIYSMMMQAWGVVRRDVLIVIDVAGEPEQKVLQEKLNLLSSTDSYGSLLKLFSDFPLLAMSTFNGMLTELGAEVILEHTFFGLDISESFYNKGFDWHPCVMSSARVFESCDKSAINYNDQFHKLSCQYRQFRSYLHQELNIGSVNKNLSHAETTHKKISLLFIQRFKNRVLTNLPALITAVLSTASDKIERAEVDLEDLSFSQQLSLFSRTDIMIAVAGTALHNAIFMQPGSSVIMLMQPGWCPWSWTYANQAALLGLHFEIHCTSLSPVTLQSLYWPTERGSPYSVDDTSISIIAGVNSFHWTRQYWKQGPRLRKADNITVNVAHVVGLILKAIDVQSEGYPSELSRAKEFKPTCPNENVQTMKPGDLKSSLMNSSAAGFQELHLEGLIDDVPLLEAYVTSVEVEQLMGGAYSLKIMGEVVARGRDSISYVKLAETFHLISVCLASLPWDAYTNMNGNDDNFQSPFTCFPLNAFNYYSHLLVGVPDALHHLHIWLQSSPTGGKIAYSDVFLTIDCRLGLDAGFDVHKNSVGLMLHLPDPVIRLLNDHFGEYCSSGIFNRDCGVSSPLRQLSVIPRQHFISSQFSLQRYTADLCRYAQVAPTTCGVVSNLLTESSRQSVLIKLLGLPPRQELPSPRSPFVFLHIEKTAGTTLREFIVESSEAHGLQYFVPCHGGLHCITLSVAQADIPSNYTLHNISIIAGHFSWGIWSEFPMFQHRQVVIQSHFSTDGQMKIYRHEPPLALTDTPTCFVMGRHPVDRVISYYYQRCYQITTCRGYGRPMNQLTTQELYDFVVYERQGESRDPENISSPIFVLDEGMSDAACRAMANEKQTSGKIFGVDDISIPEVLTMEKMLAAMQNTRHCVVGLQDRWADTKRILTYWFPWINMSTGDTERRKMHLFSSKETRDTLLPELRQIIEQENRCDIALHHQMQEMFEAQLQVIDRSMFNI